MNLIEKNAPPPRKLDTILFHLYNYPTQAKGIAVMYTDACYTSFGCDYFGLSSWGEMKFYLDTLIDRHLIDVFGTEIVEREEYHRKVNFPKKIRVMKQPRSVPALRETAF